MRSIPVFSSVSITYVCKTCGAIVTTTNASKLCAANDVGSMITAKTCWNCPDKPIMQPMCVEGKIDNSARAVMVNLMCKKCGKDQTQQKVLHKSYTTASAKKDINRSTCITPGCDSPELVIVSIVF